MKEQDIIDLGFTKKFGDNFYYYTYDFTRGFSLITQSSDEVLDNKWVVEVFDTDPTIGFTDKEHVESFINIMNNSRITKIKI